MTTPPDLRMIGTRDGLVHALLNVRDIIQRYDGPYAPKIHARHTRKLAERERILEPLRALERRILTQFESVKEALAEEVTHG